MANVAAPPPRLQAKQTVGVCLPSGPAEATALRAGLDWLTARAPVRLSPLVERHLAQPPAPGTYLAGSDDERADDFNQLVRDPQVRAIWLGRGGYGLTRILHMLDGSALRADPKPIIGFSDATALLAWADREGVRGIHGPLVVQLGRLPEEDRMWAWNLLTDPAPRRTWPVRLSGGVVATGRLVGGNLKVLANLCGTDHAIDPADQLLMIEDVGEKPYALDRDLTQLLRGSWRPPAAVVVGQLTRCTDPPHRADEVDDDVPAQAAVQRAASARSVDVQYGGEFGHGARNLAWPFGAKAELDADGRFELREPAVR